MYSDLPQLNVEQLIEKLNKMPKDSKVYFFYDSAPRGVVDEVVLNKQGATIILGDGWGMPSEEDLMTELD